MNSIPAQAVAPWSGSQRSPSHRTRTRLRDVLPPVAAVIVLSLANFAFGAVQPIAALALSAAVTVVAAVSLLAAGPRHVTFGMAAGAAAIALAAVTGLAGPLSRSAPDLAVLFAAGGMWVIGFVAARHRSALDATWTALLWGLVVYCSWMFSSDVSAATSGAGLPVVDAFTTPANASVLFGLFAVIAMARILHVVKQMDAEALPRAHMIERLLRDGLSGHLLLALSLTCLAMSGSRPGLAMTAGVLLAHVWWDTLPITSRDHRGLLTRLAALTLPFIAIGLGAWGVALGWLNDETIAPGVGQAETLPNLQRIEAYMAAWAQSPAFGHGLGSIGGIGDASMTLFNAKAMLAPGGAHNVAVTWLVETGIAGLALLVLALGAMHARIFAVLTTRRAPRTFARLAVMAGTLMLMHGLTDSSLDLPSATWLYALLLGAACGLASGGRSHSGEEAPRREAK